MQDDSKTSVAPISAENLPNGPLDGEGGAGREGGGQGPSAVAMTAVLTHRILKSQLSQTWGSHGDIRQEVTDDRYCAFMRFRCLAGRAGVCLVPMLAAAVLTPVPAYADDPISSNSNYSEATSQNKTIYTKCPFILATGGVVEDGGQEVGLTNIAVSADRKKVVVGAQEDDTGFAGVWRAGATVTCKAKPPPGTKLLAGAAAEGSPKGRSIALPCPAGTRATAVSGGVLNGKGNVFLDDLRIAEDLSSVLVTAIEDQNGYAGDWQVGARATCVSPLPGMHRVAVSSSTDSRRTKTATASCPFPARPYGAGGEIVGGAGEVRMLGVGARPGWMSEIVATEDEDGYAGNWSVTAYVVCAQ